MGLWPVGLLGNDFSEVGFVGGGCFEAVLIVFGS